MHTQELLLCDVSHLHTRPARVSPYQAREGKLFNFFLLLRFTYLALAVTSCKQKQQHMCMHLSILFLFQWVNREIKEQNP